MAAATTAPIVQMPTPRRQSPALSAIGTVSAAGRTVPTDIDVVYAAVPRPTRSGKCALTNAGSSTFPAAIPANARIVAAKNTGVASTTTRTSWPTTTATAATTSTWCSPNRRDRPAATAPTPAKHSTGNVVSSPASAADSCRSVRSSVSTGAMLATAGRRLNANPTSAAISSQAGQVVRTAVGVGTTRGTVDTSTDHMVIG
jgi:hypothetical protein